MADETLNLEQIVNENTGYYTEHTRDVGIRDGKQSNFDHEIIQKIMTLCAKAYGRFYSKVMFGFGRILGPAETWGGGSSARPVAKMEDPVANLREFAQIFGNAPIEHLNELGEGKGVKYGLTKVDEATREKFNLNQFLEEGATNKDLENFVRKNYAPGMTNLNRGSAWYLYGSVSKSLHLLTQKLFDTLGVKMLSTIFTANNSNTASRLTQSAHATIGGQEIVEFADIEVDASILGEWKKAHEEGRILSPKTYAEKLYEMGKDLKKKRYRIKDFAGALDIDDKFAVEIVKELAHLNDDAEISRENYEVNLHSQTEERSVHTNFLLAAEELGVKTTIDVAVGTLSDSFSLPNMKKEGLHYVTAKIHKDHPNQFTDAQIEEQYNKNGIVLAMDGYEADVNAALTYHYDAIKGKLGNWVKATKEYPALKFVAAGGKIAFLNTLVDSIVDFGKRLASKHKFYASELLDVGDFKEIVLHEIIIKGADPETKYMIFDKKNEAAISASKEAAEKSECTLIETNISLIPDAKRLKMENALKASYIKSGMNPGDADKEIKKFKITREDLLTKQGSMAVTKDKMLFVAHSYHKFLPIKDNQCLTFDKVSKLIGTPIAKLKDDGTTKRDFGSEKENDLINIDHQKLYSEAFAMADILHMKSGFFGLVTPGSFILSEVVGVTNIVQFIYKDAYPKGATPEQKMYECLFRTPVNMFPQNFRGMMLGRYDIPPGIEFCSDQIDHNINRVFRVNELVQEFATSKDKKVQKFLEESGLKALFFDEDTLNSSKVDNFKLIYEELKNKNLFENIINASKKLPDKATERLKFFMTDWNLGTPADELPSLIKVYNQLCDEGYIGTTLKEGKIDQEKYAILARVEGDKKLYHYTTFKDALDEHGNTIRVLDREHFGELPQGYKELTRAQEDLLITIKLCAGDINKARAIFDPEKYLASDPFFQVVHKEVLSEKSGEEFLKELTEGRSGIFVSDPYRLEPAKIAKHILDNYKEKIVDFVKKNKNFVGTSEKFQIDMQATTAQVAAEIIYKSALKAYKDKGITVKDDDGAEKKLEIKPLISKLNLKTRIVDITKVIVNNIAGIARERAA